MIAVRIDDPGASHVADLLAFHLAELHAVMGGEFAFALDAGGLSHLTVTFWTAWTGDTLAGFAALKQQDDETAEVKSMRAAPAARGTGVGRTLLLHLLAEARARGLRRLYLETGTASTHDAAVALYHRNGFVDCAAFGDYPADSPLNRYMTIKL